MNWKAGWATIYVGRDTNGNGVPDFADETCACRTPKWNSTTAASRILIPAGIGCSSPTCAPGSTDDDPTVITDTFRIATAVVPGSGGSGLQIAGPASTTGVPVALDINWNLPPMTTGDVVYGGFDVGAGNAPGSVGFAPLKITRGVDDVSMTVSQTRAKPGDILDVNLHVRENDTGEDRGIRSAIDVAAGLTHRAGLGAREQRGAASEPECRRQHHPHRRHATRFGKLAAQLHDDDERFRCDVPRADLQRERTIEQRRFRRTRQHARTAAAIRRTRRYVNATDSVTVPLSNFWDGGYALYNNGAFQSYPDLQWSPQGWIIQEPNFGDTMFVQQQFPYLTLPYTPMIGVLWKGAAQGAAVRSAPRAIDALATPLNIDFFDPTQTSGMSIAYSDTTHDLIFEWLGARSEHIDFNTGETTTLDDKYEFELLLNRDYRFGDGQYEMIMAYGNLNFGTQGGLGSIGVQGYYGPLTSFGPLDGDLAVSYGYNDLQTKLHSNMLVCYDYTGPESTQFDLSFQVRVSETASGTDQTLHWVSHIDGMTDRSIDADIAIAGNLSIADMADQTTVRTRR